MSKPTPGGYMTCGWTGVCRPAFRKAPSSNYWKLLSYPLLWWILAENHLFFAIFRQFLDNPPLFMENLPKKGPLFREFGAQKPTHMGGTYPYPQHVMYPPPRKPTHERSNIDGSGNNQMNEWIKWIRNVFIHKEDRQTLKSAMGKLIRIWKSKSEIWHTKEQIWRVKCRKQSNENTIKWIN